LLRDKSQDQQIIERLEKYIEDAAKIEAATQITELDKLLSIFKKNEEKNFNMFKYVNELSNEIEALEKSIAELKVCLQLKSLFYRKKRANMKDKAPNKISLRKEPSRIWKRISPSSRTELSTSNSNIMMPPRS
jgi:hypothetical protein